MIWPHRAQVPRWGTANSPLLGKCLHLALTQKEKERFIFQSLDQAWRLLWAFLWAAARQQAVGSLLQGLAHPGQCSFHPCPPASSGNRSRYLLWELEMGFGAGCVDIRASGVTSGKERETEREREITTPHEPELKDPFFFITPNPLWSYTFVQYHKNELLKKHWKRGTKQKP